MSASARRISAVIIKNTSTIDFIAPIFWGLRRSDPGIELSLFYAVTSRRKILRGSDYYDRLFAEIGVRCYDYLDFLRGIRFARVALRSIIDQNDWDIASEDRGTRPLASGLKRYLEHLARFFIVPGSVLRSLRPDAILFDNRTSTEPLGRQYLFRDLAQSRMVFLLPHAPHNTRSDEFIGLDEEAGLALPDNCEYWVTLPQERPWENRPDLNSSQFSTVGYPGLDSEWLNWILGRKKPMVTRENRPLRLLFIVRAYRGSSSGRYDSEASDPFLLEEIELRQFCRAMVQAIGELSAGMEVIVKPHPSNNFISLKQLLCSEGAVKWVVSDAPIYNHLHDVDIVVSLYSTILLVPAVIGIPTVVLHSRTQEYVHSWEPLRKLYTGLPGYLKEISQLGGILQALEKIARERRKGATHDFTEKQSRHVRSFFPDHSIESCLKRIHAGIQGAARSPKRNDSFGRFGE